MVQRGRKSAASLAIVPRIYSAPERPEPPSEISAEEARVWREVVGAMSSEWFATAETHVLLRTFCCHVRFADLLAAALRVTDLHRDLSTVERLAGMYARETAILISLATKMRLTHQSSFDPKKKKHEPSGPKPWEF